MKEAPSGGHRRRALVAFGSLRITGPMDTGILATGSARSWWFPARPRRGSTQLFDEGARFGAAVFDNGEVHSSNFPAVIGLDRDSPFSAGVIALVGNPSPALLLTSVNGDWNRVGRHPPDARIEVGPAHLETIFEVTRREYPHHAEYAIPGTGQKML